MARRATLGDVFRPAEDGGWHRNAVAGGLLASDGAYALGYKEAADIVVESVLEEGPQDLLFYPICFLYRHAAEIALKDLRRDTERLIRLLVAIGQVDADPVEPEDLDKQLNASHRLGPLLSDLIDRLKLVERSAIPPEVVAAIKELDRLDPTGQTFRYARVKQKGKTTPSLPTQELYDLGRLRDRIGSALTFLLDGVGTWLEVELDGAKEYAAYLEDAVPDPGWA